MRTIQLVRIYLSLSARAAVPIGTPLFFGIFIVAFVVFGPTGMRASDLVFTMRTSPLFAVALWFGWIVLVFPVARLALVPPSSMYLRWLPAPRSVLYVSAAFCGFVVELPWMILWGRGAGIVSALTAGLGALTVHAAWATPPFGVIHVLFLLGWALSAFVPIPGLALFFAGLTSALAVKRAIDRAPEVHAMARGAMRVRAPVMALARAHVVYLIRKEPAVLGRMVVLSSLAGIILPLAARGHDLELPQSFGALSLALAAIALSPAISGVSGAVLRSERLSAWICDVLGISARTRVVAASLASAGIGAGAGALMGLVAISFMTAPAWTIVVRVIAIPVCFGAEAACILTGLARENEASSRRGDRGMVSALVVMIGGIVFASLWGERAVVVYILAAALGVIIMPHRMDVMRQRRGTS